MKTLTTVLVIVFAALLCSAAASAQSVGFAPSPGTTINVQHGGVNYFNTAFIYATAQSNDYISWMTSSQGAPPGCTETFVYPYGTTGGYVAVACGNDAVLGDYTYTVRVLTHLNGSGSASYTIHIY